MTMATRQQRDTAGMRTLRSWTAAAALLAVAALGGCSRLRPKPPVQYVYVVSKQVPLRDRIAAVSTRTGSVTNGERLEVLERGRRFLRVKSEKGEQGWVDERLVADQKVYDVFEALKTQYANAPTVASGTARDEVYMHTKPGRDTDHLFRLNESDKIQLLRRAIVEKPQPVQSVKAAPRNAPPSMPGTGLPAKGAPVAAPAPVAPSADAPPPMIYEDWWLVRAANGEVGWLLSRMIDVDAPDAITRYSEGQRIVGAYVLATVYDPDALTPKDEGKKDGKPAVNNDRANVGVGVTIVGTQNTNPNIPEYVALMGPYKAGLPYDFDQVRVFSWNLKKHRYETAYREKNIEGYLPIQIKTATDPAAKPGAPNPALPAFTYKVLPLGAPPVVPDENGELHPKGLVERTLRLEGNLIRRITVPGAPPVELAHPEAEPDKKAKKATPAKHR